MPPRGIVASQARRFSQDITAASSVASKVQSLNASNLSFFPTCPVPVEKTFFPVYNPDDTKRSEPMVFPPPGFGAHLGGGTVMRQEKRAQEHHRQQQLNKTHSISYSAKPFSYTATSDLNAITIPSITQFKPMMNSNSNKNSSLSSSSTFAAAANRNQTNQSNLPSSSSPSVFPPTMNNPLANQQQQPSSGNYGAPAPTLPPLTSAPLSCSSAANGTASSASFGQQQQQQQASFKSTSSAAAASVGASVMSGANCFPSTTNTSNANNNKNNNKGGAGITVGPKRGRGVMNKAVAPGGRVPLCGCCNSQIRLAECRHGFPVCLIVVHRLRYS